MCVASDSFDVMFGYAALSQLLHCRFADDVISVPLSVVIEGRSFYNF